MYKELEEMLEYENYILMRMYQEELSENENEIEPLQYEEGVS